MSAPESQPPPGSSLLQRLGWRLKDTLVGTGDEPRATDPVKVIHADELRAWDRFPRCQEFDGITLGEVRQERRRLEVLRRSVANLVDAMRELDSLDSDEIVEYHAETVEVPRRVPGRRRFSHELGASRPATWLEPSAGAVEDGSLEVERQWRRQRVTVRYRGRSRDVNAERIETLRTLLQAMSQGQRETIDAINASRYSQPVIFVSHRWESGEHPDPDGNQLRKLCELRDCFLVYDYTSFPQPPRDAGAKAEFDQILAAMSELVRNVIVLGAGDYLTRGWCVYEYLLSALHQSTVCDELHDERFVRLRDWASTPPPFTAGWRDGFEARQQNAISDHIIDAVMDILPLYGEGAFQSEHDREVVTGLLVEHLKSALPPQREYAGPYGNGEWFTKPWTDEALAPLFAAEAERPALQSTRIASFDSAVPSSLGDAVAGGYGIARYPVSKLLDQSQSVVRALEGGR